MIATKEQERKALAQIKKIVESLGENSYIGIAFEGCFEIAEENIENDFGCSMKQRYEDAERRAEEAEKDYEAAHAAAHEISEEKDAIIENLKNENAFLKERTLSGAELSRVSYYVSLVGIEAEDKMKKEAERIVENAENPNGDEFQNAVESNRKYRKMYEECKGLNQRVMNCIG